MHHAAGRHALEHSTGRDGSDRQRRARLAGSDGFSDPPGRVPDASSAFDCGRDNRPAHCHGHSNGGTDNGPDVGGDPDTDTNDAYGTANDSSDTDRRTTHAGARVMSADVSAVR